VLATALLLNMAASALTPAGEVPLASNATARSMQEFSRCFMASQERQSRPLWIVPNEGGGGRISNDGAQGVTNPYRIRFTPAGASNEVQLFLAQRDPAEEQALLEAVRGCW
jgi:hypothetical protein